MENCSIEIGTAHSFLKAFFVHDEASIMPVVQSLINNAEWS